jgi:tRNA(Ile)-lysidine synthase
VKAAAQDRFAADLSRITPGGRLGVAVSGGPDSLALLLLAAAARPGEVEAATVDHGLRPDSGEEARMMARLCAGMDVPHVTLPVTVTPAASLQAKAREARYAALAGWAKERGLSAIATAHHADDQAETILMRLARGAGLGGLAGVRERRVLGGAMLVRPLLGWRKQELAAIVASAGLTAIDDPANRDVRHNRTRVRGLLTQAAWLDPLAVAASAAHLAEAETALQFAADQLWRERVTDDERGLAVQAHDLPREFQRRLLLLAIAWFGNQLPRGPDLDRALAVLMRGGACTLGSLKLAGGASWRITPAPPRRVSSRRAARP